MKQPTAMHGKVCVITGANSGIGKATALGLAKLGATVVLVCRDHNRGQAARADVVNRSGNTSIDLIVADLSSQADVRQLAQTFCANHSRCHVLINDAAVNLSQRTLTRDGLETTFAVNYLAPFLLTNLLLPTLKASAPARVVNIMGWEGDGHLNFDDLMSETNYSGLRAYQQSKAALALFTQALAKRLDRAGVTVNAANPGFVRTNLGRDAQGVFKLFLTVMRPFMVSPDKGAQTPIYVASSPDLDGVTGQYFTDKKSSAAFYAAHNADADRLWQISAELARLNAEECYS